MKIPSSTRKLHTRGKKKAARSVQRRKLHAMIARRRPHHRQPARQPRREWVVRFPPSYHHVERAGQRSRSGASSVAFAVDDHVHGILQIEINSLRSAPRAIGGGWPEAGK